MLPDKTQSIMGWDIGGANVKVACAIDQSISEVYQLVCPLWKGLHELHSCFERLQKKLDFSHYKHAITMTGELVDHFENREKGVLTIIDEMSTKLSEDNIFFFAGDHGFVTASDAVNKYKNIASANWLASAQYVAEKMQHALFIDIGSTTTDIVPIKDNKVVYKGYNDAERLVAKELVYCGVIRTPIFAICKSAIVNSEKIPIINEYFAETADVYRIMKELPTYADLGDTLDGRDKGVENSMKRLARMFAHDAISSEQDIWSDVARQVRSSQLQMIKDACRHQLMNKSIPLSTPVVGAGIGRFLAKELASELGREYVEYESLFVKTEFAREFNIGDCAPAAAIACLANS